MKLEETVAQRDEEIAQLSKKLKRQEALNQPVFPCAKCTKNFVSAALLENHVQRKHPPVQESKDKDKDSNLINTIKLELEIKQLKEKLNITEKELTDVTRKEVMECQKCKANAERMFQNVGIQSNFEEKEKDDVEKEVIYEMFNNQMKNFEEWKREEEMRYRSEIFELRRKLDETIETLKENANHKKSQPPSPAPRLLQSVETVKNVEVQVEDTLWKDRYKELEKMYEENQQKMALTVKSIEASYIEKMSKFEESVKNMSEERERIRVEALKKDAETNTRREVPLTPKVVQTIFAQEFSPESSSETEEEFKYNPTAHKLSEIDEIREAPEPEKPKTIMESFSAQKFKIRPKKPQKQKLTTIKESPLPLKSSRDKAEKLFNQRLKSFGLLRSEERMNKLEFENVHDQMVASREEIKGKHKSFFITRKNLRTKVEKIFTQKHKHRTKKDQTLFMDSDKSSVFADDVETQNSPKISTKQKFHDDLEQILAKRLSSSALKNPSTQDVEHLPATSLKSKKVLFNMEHLKEAKEIEEIRVANEDDSDFDISSFSNFTTEEEK